MHRVLVVILILALSFLTVAVSVYFIPRSPSSSQDSKSDLRARLTPLQYTVTQENGTEPPFKNEYWDNKQAGLYVDIIDGTPLFSSLDKYDSGTGWPSFVKPLDPSALSMHEDISSIGKRTEVRSSKANSHLGHVFDDGPPDRGGLRYCINSAALRFIPVEDLEKEGYGEWTKLFDTQKTGTGDMVENN